MLVSRIRTDRNCCVVDSSLYSVPYTRFGLNMAIRRVLYMFRSQHGHP